MEQREEDYHYVEGGDDIRLEYPEKAQANPSTCTAVGILNTKTGVGYLGHYIADDKSSELLVDEAISEADDASDLEVAVAGNIPLDRHETDLCDADYEKEYKKTIEHGEWLIDMIKSKGITRIANYLSTDPRDSDGVMGYIMIVNTEEGRITVEKYRSK